MIEVKATRCNVEIVPQGKKFMVILRTPHGNCYDTLYADTPEDIWDAVDKGKHRHGRFKDIPTDEILCGLFTKIAVGS